MYTCLADPSSWKMDECNYVLGKGPIDPRGVGGGGVRPAAERYGHVGNNRPIIRIF